MTKQAETYEALSRLGLLDRIDPVPAARQLVAVARTHLAAVEARAAEDAPLGTGSNRDRREARARAQALKEDLEDAAGAVDDAQRALRQARADAFHRVSPLIRQQYRTVLPELERALRAVLAAADAVKAVETLAGNCSLPSEASMGFRESAVAGTLGERTMFEVARLLDMLKAVRPAGREQAA